MHFWNRNGRAARLFKRLQNLETASIDLSYGRTDRLACSMAVPKKNDVLAALRQTSRRRTPSHPDTGPGGLMFF